MFRQMVGQTCRGEVGAIWLFELGLMQQLMQPRYLLVIQLAVMCLNLYTTAHFIYQPPYKTQHQHMMRCTYVSDNCMTLLGHM